jgi:hypothetical protein
MSNTKMLVLVLVFLLMTLFSPKGINISCIVF